MKKNGYNLRTILLVATVIAGGVLFPAVSSLHSAEKDDPATQQNPARKKFRKSRLTHDETEGVADRRRLLLTTGEDKVVDLDMNADTDRKFISIGNPQIVEVTLVKVGDKPQLIFKPLKAGETTVSIRDTAGEIKVIFTVRVTGSNLLRTAGEIRSLLRDIEGLQIRVVGGKVILEGEILVPADYGRLFTVINDKSYSDVVINLATLSTYALQLLARRIQEDVNAFAPNVKTRVVNGTIFLEGTVDNADEARRAAQVASLYVPEIRPGDMLDRDTTAKRLSVPRALVQNFIIINPKPPKKQEKLVRVTVHFVELSKDYNKVFGFKWQPGFTADPQITIGTAQTGGAAAGGGASFTATISSLIPKLQSAQTAGYARILKSGTVIVRSGQPAKLSELTQFSFQQIGPNGQQTFGTKDVGLTVAVTPKILGQSEDIEMDLDMDQTNVVKQPPAPGAPPVTASHKVATKLYVKTKESAAVAGVTASTIGTYFNKDDPKANGSSSEGANGAQTEAIFTLLRTKKYAKEKSQFVIFVTPEIVENASDGTEDLRKNFRVNVK